MTQRHYSPSRGWHRVGLGALLVLLPSLQALAAPDRLSELWLAQEGLLEEPAYRYYLLNGQQEAQQRLGRRLHEELATLVERYTLSGYTDLARGLAQWQDTIAELDAAPGRTPARADLAALLASPRHDPALDSLAAAGQCAIPEWVELWQFQGVTRHPWRPGLSLRDLLNEQPRGYWSQAEEAWLISPHGEPRRIGVAAWNAGNAALVPGSRVALALPDELLEAGWINRNLPGFLATRLPGDSCQALATSRPSQADPGRPAQ
jgi:hypothetical protein